MKNLKIISVKKKTSFNYFQFNKLNKEFKITLADFPEVISILLELGWDVWADNLRVKLLDSLKIDI